MTLAKDLIQKPITITINSSVSDVIEKLLFYNISRIIVTDKENPGGIVAEKDIGNFLFRDKTKRSLEEIPINELIRKIIYVDGSTAIDECARIMISKKIGSLVVDSKKISGILTKTDIIRDFAENQRGKYKVVELKNPGYVSVNTETSLSDVIKKMIKKNIGRIIVTDQKGKPVGIISYRDFFRISLQLGTEKDVTEASSLSGHVRTGFLWEGGFGGITIARDIMTQKIISVKPDDDLAEACKIMLENHINSLAIVDDEGKMGILSKTDIVQFLT